MSTEFMMYGNTNKHTMELTNPVINYIHDIKVSYVTTNNYIVKFVIPGVNTFRISGVNYIHDLQIRYANSIDNKFYFDQLN